MCKIGCCVDSFDVCLYVCLYVQMYFVCVCMYEYPMCVVLQGKRVCVRTVDTPTVAVLSTAAWRVSRTSTAELLAQRSPPAAQASAGAHWKTGDAPGESSQPHTHTTTVHDKLNTNKRGHTAHWQTCTRGAHSSHSSPHTSNEQRLHILQLPAHNTHTFYAGDVRLDMSSLLSEVMDQSVRRSIENTSSDEAVRRIARPRTPSVSCATEVSGCPCVVLL